MALPPLRPTLRSACGFVGRAALALFGLSLALSMMGMGDETAERREYLARYNCGIATRLSVIRDLKAPKSRYLILSRADDAGAYVQCMFNEAADILYCEVASGFYRVKDGTPWTPTVSNAGQEALRRLGFDTAVEKGNYKQELTIRSGADLEHAADLVLSVLFDAYGARVSTPLLVEAPLANLQGLVPPSCAPAS